MHFNKSPHASEHIYYSFWGAVGAVESAAAAPGNELGGVLGAGSSMDLPGGAEGACALRRFRSMRRRETSQLPAVWFLAPLGGKGPRRWGSSSGWGVLGSSCIPVYSRTVYVSAYPAMHYLSCVSLQFSLWVFWGDGKYCSDWQSSPHHQHPPRLLKEAPHHGSGFCLPG